MKRKYKSFNDLPEKIRKELLLLDPGDLESYISRPIPAAGNRILLDILNEEGMQGEEYVLKFIRNAQGKCM